MIQEAEQYRDYTSIYSTIHHWIHLRQLLQQSLYRGLTPANKTQHRVLS